MSDSGGRGDREPSPTVGHARSWLSSPKVQHSVSGGLAGFTAAVITLPLDVCKIRLAVQNRQLLKSSGVLTESSQYTVSNMLKRIYSREGVAGLYRGLGPTCVVFPLFWGTYFSCYNAIKEEFSARYDLDDHPYLIHLSSACCAGAITDVTTNPFWVVRTRMQTQHMLQAESGYRGSSPKPDKYRNTFQTLGYLWRKEGVQSWFKGLTASFLGLSHVMVQFPIYEKLKKVLGGYFEPACECFEEAEEKEDTQSFAYELCSTGLVVVTSSSLSKIVASMVTYPHEVLRFRMQYSTRHTSLTQCIRNTYKENGIKAFYQGFNANLAKTVPSAALVFVAYEIGLKAWARHFPNIEDLP